MDTVRVRSKFGGDLKSGVKYKWRTVKTSCQGTFFLKTL